MHKMLYTPQDICELDYNRDLGDPGCEPFTRGIHQNMYNGKPFTMRQLTGFGSPENTNERMKFMLDHGATGLSILFDFPTIQMYDSDDPLSMGHVGFSGVCVDSIEDMKILFKDIDIENISVSIVTHYPSNTAILFSMFLAMAEEQGISLSKLRGSVQNDVTMEEVVRCAADKITPKNCFRIQCDNIEYIMNNMPKWNPVTFNGYNLRDCGTDAIVEMAVALANARETISELIKRGYDSNNITSRLAFFWSIGNDFFEEVARLRAVRRIWYKLLKEKFDVTNIKSLKMKCHVQTSGITLVRQEPLNNIVRSAYQALSAIFGGVQSLHVDSYDESYSIPTEEAALISLRTQQIIQEETNITNIVDPLGGSYYVEALTNEIEKKILGELDKIEKKGGYVSLVESGNLHRDIDDFVYNEQKDIESGVKSIVGVNKYVTSNNTTPIQTFIYPDGVEEQQIERNIKLKTNRDNTKVEQSLKELENACKSNTNIVPFCIECAKVRCTEGEMFKVFKRHFGTWRI